MGPDHESVLAVAAAVVHTGNGCTPGGRGWEKKARTTMTRARTARTETTVATAMLAFPKAKAKARTARPKAKAKRIVPKGGGPQVAQVKGLLWTNAKAKRIVPNGGGPRVAQVNAAQVEAAPAEVAPVEVAQVSRSAKLDRGGKGKKARTTMTVPKTTVATAAVEAAKEALRKEKGCEGIFISKLVYRFTQAARKKMAGETEMDEAELEAAVDAGVTSELWRYFREGPRHGGKNSRAAGAAGDQCGASESDAF